MIPLEQCCQVPFPLMGHGLVVQRSQTYISAAVMSLLEKEFAKGEKKSSNRKGVLEMVETCSNTLPVLLVPSIQAVSSWLAGRLKQTSDALDGSEGSSSKSNKPKRFAEEWQQSSAEVLTESQRKAATDQTKEHLFLATYQGVLLVKDGITRMITSVKFDAMRRIWVVLAARAE